jgi:hypothetical protein
MVDAIRLFANANCGRRGRVTNSTYWGEPMRALALVCGLFFANSAFSEIREIKYLSQILDGIDSDTLVVTDVDNTELEPVQVLGSDQWYGYLVAANLKRGLSQKEATDKAIELWMMIQKVMSVKTVEPQTASVLRIVQAKAGATMGLTARPIALVEATQKQLDSVGIDLAQRTIVPYDVPLVNNVEGLFTEGILFLGPNGNKGVALKDFLGQLNLLRRFKKIVFVDDRESHVKRVEAAFKDSGIRNINFRYSYLDQKVASFDPATADRQLGHFIVTGQFLTDEEAQSCGKNLENH